MKTVGSAVMAIVVALTLVCGAVASAPSALAADCEEGAIAPADDGSGTYSQCLGGVWVYVNQQLCVDFPDFSPHCTGIPPTETTSSSTPPPVPPPPVVAPPPVVVDTPYVPVPSVPNMSVPGVGCTWVNGYTKKNGTSVRGYWRC